MPQTPIDGLEEPDTEGSGALARVITLDARLRKRFGFRLRRRRRLARRRRDRAARTDALQRDRAARTDAARLDRAARVDAAQRQHPARTGAPMPRRAMDALHHVCAALALGILAVAALALLGVLTVLAGKHARVALPIAVAVATACMLPVAARVNRGPAPGLRPPRR